MAIFALVIPVSYHWWHRPNEPIFSDLLARYVFEEL
jgi:hypothetical protein